MPNEQIERWITKNNLKKTRNHAAGSYKVAADINGNINVNITIRRDALALVLDMAATLYHAATESIAIEQRQAKQLEVEQVQSLVNIERGKIEDRIALSVFRRTGSRRLAARCLASGSHTSVMFLVNIADKEQRKAHIKARNGYMHHLHIKKGESIRTIAKRYKLHPSTIHTIIKRESKMAHPALF